MHRTISFAAMLILIGSAAAETQNTACESGRQHYKTFCISNDMSDLLACVESSGGNRQELITRLDKTIGSSQTGGGKIEAHNQIIGGSGSLNVAKDLESRVVQELGEKYFSGSMEICAGFAKSIRGRVGTRSSPQNKPRLPVTVTASSDAVTFFPGFTAQITEIGGFADRPFDVQLVTKENGNVRLKTDAVPVDVTFRGINYQLIAKLNDKRIVLLTLSAKQ